MSDGGLTAGATIASSLMGANATGNATNAQINSNQQMSKDQLAQQQAQYEQSFNGLTASQQQAYTEYLQSLGMTGTQQGINQSQFGQNLSQQNQNTNITAGQNDILKQSYNKAIGGAHPIQKI